MWHEKALFAAEYIKNSINKANRTFDIPKAAIVLGSALGSFADNIENATVIPYSDIPGFSVSTVSGHSGNLIYGYINNVPVICMKGRTHIYEGNSPSQVVLPVRTFAALGIKNIILTNAAGGINSNFKTGDFMIIEDHISFFLESPLTGANEDHLGIRFPSMDNAYDADFRKIAFNCAKNIDLDVKTGVYAYMKGPQFETPAEIRALKILGTDAVGMSTVPETIAAVHAGMKVLGISCISNMAAGITDKTVSHEDVNSIEKVIALPFYKWLEAIICQL